MVLMLYCNTFKLQAFRAQACEFNIKAIEQRLLECVLQENMVSVFSNPSELCTVARVKLGANCPKSKSPGCSFSVNIIFVFVFEHFMSKTGPKQPA